MIKKIPWLSILAGSVSLVGLLSIHFFPKELVIISTIIIWISILFLIHYFVYRFPEYIYDFFLACSLVFSFSVLVSIVEDVQVTYFLICCGTMMIGTLFNHYGEGIDLHRFKPRRRMHMMFWIASGYAFSAFLFALSTFFQGFWFWLGSVLLAIYIGLSFIMIWKMYFPVAFKHLLLWGILGAFLIWELIWVLHILPYGYFVSAFFVAWVAYILQLFVRFELSSKGIVWKKQLYFLVTNAILYILVLFLFVRWV
jgi:hypothetical protein